MKKTIYVDVDAEVYKQTRVRAVEYKLHLNKLVEQALVEYLERHNE